MGKTGKVSKAQLGGSEAELKALTHSLLKRLKERQLEGLLQAVESKGGTRSPCLLLPSAKLDSRLGQQPFSLPLLLCKLFRWPDLRHSAEVKRLSCCESYGKNNPELVCCNPHHLSRLCELGMGVPGGGETVISVLHPTLYTMHPTMICHPTMTGSIHHVPQYSNLWLLIIICHPIISPHTPVLPYFIYSASKL